jgi:Zn-finger nucleic acid-binding protein
MTPRADSMQVAEALRRMTEAPPGPNAALVAEGERPCPICGRAMVVQNDGGIALDVCPRHGIWLDRGELKALLRRPRRKTKGLVTRLLDRSDGHERFPFQNSYGLRIGFMR